GPNRLISNGGVMPQAPAIRAPALAKAMSIGCCLRLDWRAIETSCRWRILVQRCPKPAETEWQAHGRLGFSVP
ncbi:MAG: hypothetical protein KDI75_04295, partial [Xanthomonadales bacterium]|nr:hypothetical protein [Xanthomonadales bacterium]